MLQRRSIKTLGLHAARILTSGQRTKLVKSCIAGFVNAALEWISLAAVIPLLYHLIGNGNVTQFYPTALQDLSKPVLFVLILIVFLFKTMASLWLANAQFRVTNQIYLDLSERLYENYFRQDYITYTNTNYADAFRRIKNTAFDFSNHVIHGFLVVLADAMICIVTTALMIWIDYRIVVAMFILGIPTLVFHYFAKKKWIKKIDEAFRKLTPEANVILSQGLESYSEARIYHAESYFIKTFINISDKTSDLLGKLKVLATLPAKIMEVVGITCFTIVAFFASGIIVSTETLMMLGLLSLSIYRIMPSFNRMISGITQIQSYAYSLDEIAAITEQKADRRQPSDNRLPFTHSIQLEDIRFAYNRSGRDLYSNLNITVCKGDFIVLTGASGSGKTTLVHMLAGLLWPTSGKIKIDESPLDPTTTSQWQNCIGYVPQAPVVHNDTILKNILFTKKESLNQQHLQTAIEVSGLGALIAELPDGIETRVGEHGLSLSGGQRQRLVLARALYRNPSVLLLDEVTNQLDETSKPEVLAKLKALTEKGTTIILSSHDRAALSFATKEIHLTGRVQETSNVFQ